MDLLKTPNVLEPTLILIAWTAVLGVIALLFLLLVRAAGRAAARIADDELDELRCALAQAEELQRNCEQRERLHLAEIARLRRRLDGLQEAA